MGNNNSLKNYDNDTEKNKNDLLNDLKKLEKANNNNAAQELLTKINDLKFEDNKPKELKKIEQPNEYKDIEFKVTDLPNINDDEKVAPKNDNNNDDEKVVSKNDDNDDDNNDNDENLTKLKSHQNN